MYNFGCLYEIIIIIIIFDNLGKRNSTWTSELILHHFRDNYLILNFEKILMITIIRIHWLS